MSTFAQEFKNMKSQGAPKTQESTDTAPETPNQTTMAPDSDLAIFGQPFQAPAPSEPPVLTAPKVEPKVEIKIGGKTFESQQDALNYANELALIQLQDEAFKQGLEVNKPKPAVEPEPDLDEELANEIFENPKAAIAKLRKQIRTEMQKDINSNDEAKIMAVQREAQIKSTWDNFYKTNSDLSDFNDEVNTVLSREWAKLEKLPAEKGMEELAVLSRKYVASLREKILPKQALSSAQAKTGGASGIPASATLVPATQEKVSFISQIKTMNKRTTG